MYDFFWKEALQIHNYILSCILSRHFIQVFHWWQRLLHKVFVKIIDSLYVSINHHPQHVLCFYIISYLCVMHLLSVWRSKIFLLKKSFVDLNFIPLIHSYVYNVIKNYIYKTPVIIWPCHILYRENYHQLFKHWFLNVSKISWLHVLNVLFFHPIS